MFQPTGFIDGSTTLLAFTLFIYLIDFVRQFLTAGLQPIRLEIVKRFVRIRFAGNRFHQISVLERLKICPIFRFGKQYGRSQNVSERLITNIQLRLQVSNISLLVVYFSLGSIYGIEWIVEAAGADFLRSGFRFRLWNNKIALLIVIDTLLPEIDSSQYSSLVARKSRICIIFVRFSSSFSSCTPKSTGA